MYETEVKKSIQKSIQKQDSLVEEEEYFENSILSCFEGFEDQEGLIPNTCTNSYINMEEVKDQTVASDPTNADIMKCLKSVEAQVRTVDRRLKALEGIEVKVNKIEVDMKKLWSYIEDNRKRTDDRFEKVEEKIESTDFSLGIASSKIAELENDRKQLTDDISYLQSQSMRNNLLFGNIEEAPTGETENTEVVLRKFLCDKMRIAQNLIDSMRFERVHRIGERSGQRKRNIVAKFTLFKEREMVRKQWKTLQGTEYYFTEQFPKEVNQKRRKLLPQLKEAKKAGKRAWLAYDTLYIDGKPVKADK